MTKEQAIEILNQAISQIQTTRQGHELLLKALNILAIKDVKADGEV